jgi:DNA-binding SARP family transcriptional activator
MGSTLNNASNEWQTTHQLAKQLEQWLRLPTSSELTPDIDQITPIQPVVANTPTPLLAATKPLQESQLCQTDDYVELDVYFFGKFRIYRDGELVDNLCKNRAKQLLKYLVLNRTKAIPKEMLMDHFWPNYDPSSARNNLNVAIYCLRQALKSQHGDVIHILFQDGCYSLNPNLRIRVDTELFSSHMKAAETLDSQAKQEQAIQAYIAAEKLYQGDFLEEDIYEDWSLSLREYYKATYEKILAKLSDYYYQQDHLEECIVINRKITLMETADEHAHRRLMECFIRLNQRHFALRQYHLCKAALAKELGLKPSQDTVTLYESIKSQSAPKSGDNLQQVAQLKRA